MNFDYSDDQTFMKDEARKFLASVCPTSRVRSVLNDASKGYDAELWKSVAEMGWLGINIPTEYCGLGLGPVELCAIAEELGRALAPIPFSSTVYLFAEAVKLAGSGEQCARFLPAIARGEVIGCVATSEGVGPVKYDQLSARVAGGRLNGEKIPVTDGGIADYAIVLAVDDVGTGLYIADLRAEGVSRRTLTTLDPSRDSAALSFTSVPVERIGEPNSGARLIDLIFQRAAAYLAFEQIGGSDRALEMTKDYLLDRYAFGRPIASYQAIKHKLADIYIRNQLARSNAYYGAWALGETGGQLGRAAAAARVAASDAYWLSSKEMLELFGGIGITWEADPHLHYRRAKQLATMVGGPMLWKERLVTELEHEQAA